MAKRAELADAGKEKSRICLIGSGPLPHLDLQPNTGKAGLVLSLLTRIAAVACVRYVSASFVGVTLSTVVFAKAADARSRCRARAGSRGHLCLPRSPALAARMPPHREGPCFGLGSNFELCRSPIRRRGPQILQCCNSRRTPALLAAVFVGCARRPQTPRQSAHA
jgi:hypothetical protein